MTNRRRAARRSPEGGFTLLELMVVVLIIALLIAIAIPTFLGARRRAQDRQAQSHLRAALIAQKVHYTKSLRYTSLTSDLDEVESRIAWGNPDAAVAGVVVEDVSPSGEAVVLRTLSRSRTLFCIADVAVDFDYTYLGVNQAGTYYARVEGSGSASACEPAVASWGTTLSAWSY